MIAPVTMKLDESSHLAFESSQSFGSLDSFESKGKLCQEWLIHFLARVGVVWRALWVSRIDQNFGNQCNLPTNDLKYFIEINCTLA